ncbi:21558_t:CDS:2 [Cetraspora pellucida]|uniref:21558_t:CDS:1 n=1 Tax=Cetraspora pellucida TaxID=1433469 RepID=A0A9N9IRB9_9GLOM|nr:21558_t:CDS:2 [Cetraspora pellucida]
MLENQFTSIIASIQFINYVSPSSQDNNIITRTQIKTSKQFKVIDNESNYDESIPSSKFWSDSETRTLISYLSDNFDLYHKNKSKFYSMAANKIGNNRTSAQVNSKIQSLRTRYENENKEETSKTRSKWSYLDDMNEISGNKENIKLDYLASSIDINDKNDVNDKGLAVSNYKKQKNSELDQMYLDELRFLRKTKKEKEKFVKEQELKFKLEMKRMEKEFQYNLQVKEHELKYKE